MELLIKECPACGAVVMGDERVCSGCGKELPADVRQASSGNAAAANEKDCPKCGMKVPRGVLRCRDCGTYMSPDVEAAAMAQQASRLFTPGGSSGGLSGGAAFGSAAYYQSRAASSANSSFAEVADDADFDLVSGVGMADVNMRDIDENRMRMHGQQTTGSGSEDDFELGDGTGAIKYGAADESGSTAVEEPAAPPEGEISEPAAPSAEAAPGNAPPLPDVAHSIETAGDVLLDAALAEQQETAQRSKGGRRRVRRTAVTALAGDRFLIFCPNGHRVQVQERHRGRTGRCPNCKALFFVPMADTNLTLGQAGGPSSPADAVAGATADGSGAASIPGGYSKWITDVRLHRVNPAKLKLKPGSLEAEYETADLGACPEHLLIAVVYSGSGPFRAMQEPKKKPATRQAMLDHLAAKKPVEELPVPKKYPLTPELLAQLKIVQPPVPGEESMFVDVPVFGQGRIAIRVPAADSSGERGYLSFTLSQFRELSQTLSDVFGLADYGSGTPIPLTDDLTESTCHYSETVLRSLPKDRLDYYRADPALKLVVVGRRCEKCGLVVSEDSRKKEKIGGKSDASIAKALCPKCKAKFGNITLYGFPASA